MYELILSVPQRQYDRLTGKDQQLIEMVTLAKEIEGTNVVLTIPSWYASMACPVFGLRLRRCWLCWENEAVLPEQFMTSAICDDCRIWFAETARKIGLRNTTEL